MSTENTTLEKDSFVPPELWGRDHWSTLAYVECKIVDGGYQVKFDANMRQKRRNYRVLFQALPFHRREMGAIRGCAMQQQYGSRLSDGTYLPWHDDWDCLQDMLHVGMFEGDEGKWDVQFKLRLTKLGKLIAAQLRGHKADGGSFATFKTPEELMTEVRT